MNVRISPGSLRTRFLLIFAAVAIATAAGWYLLQPRKRVPQPLSLKEPSERHRPAGEPGRFEGELTSDGRVARIHHKAVNGLSPLELVHTPEGVVTIQRTFSKEGALLDETASLNERPLAVPRC